MLVERKTLRIRFEQVFEHTLAKQRAVSASFLGGCRRHKHGVVGLEHLKYLGVPGGTPQSRVLLRNAIDKWGARRHGKAVPHQTRFALEPRLLKGVDNLLVGGVTVVARTMVEKNVELRLVVHLLKEFPRPVYRTLSVRGKFEAELFDHIGESFFKIAHHLAGVVARGTMRQFVRFKHGHLFIRIFESKKCSCNAGNARSDYGDLGCEVGAQADVPAALVELMEPGRAIFPHPQNYISSSASREA